MIDSVKYAVCALCLIIAISKGIQHHRRKDTNPASCYAISCFVLLGLAAVVIAPSTLRFASAFEPLPNLTRWLGNSIVIAAGWCVFAILAYTVRDPGNARRLVIRHATAAALVSTSMGVLLIIGDTRFTAEFVTVYGNSLPITAYLVLFSAYCASAFAAFLALIRRYSAATPERPLRIGLNTMMVGAFAGLLWAAWKTVVLVVNRISPQPVAAEALITALLSSTAAALIAIGAVIPLVIRYIGAPIRRARTARYDRELTPLWRQVHHALPEINLSPIEDSGDEFSIYRRVIEIRDANLALRAHCHPQLRRWATDAAHHHGITGDQVQVVVEAAVTAGAIEAHAVGVRFHTAPSTAEASHIGAGDLSAERDWLIRVSRAFAQDLVVQQIRQRVREELGSAAPEKR
ncbi:MAB_1171c family putative transporter [Nocardia sp. NPDC052566]|uniref:MAB_1171c family putative transporter n=1 Tax=Nocardia sp. NPDC052566 TaxID=3364330 RepID=UPI0037C6CB94